MSRPWWVSDPHAAGDGAVGDGSVGEGSVGEGPVADGAVGQGADHDAHPPGECQACPLCALLRAVGEVRPEVVSHLAEVARHLTLAAKAVVDAQAADPGSRWQRIAVDEEW